MAHIPNGADYGRYSSGLVTHPMAMAHILDPGTLRAMLFPNAWQGNRFILDDFEGDTLNTFLWSVDGDTGTTSFAIPAAGSTIAASIIKGDTSTDDNEGISIYGHATWSGDKNAGMAVRWRSSVVALTYQELGFTDPLTDYTLPAINDIDTPTITNGAVTVAVQARDASQTLTSMALIADGDSTYATSKVNHGTFTPSVDTWYTSIVQLNGDTVFSYIYDSNTPSAPTLVAGGFQSAVAAVEGGTLVQPWFFFGNKTSNSASVDLDFIAVWADR